MTIPERIPTEIIQLFTSHEAWSYRLVPYARKGDGCVSCVGEKSRNYTNVIQEIEVLSGFKIAIEPIESNELSRLLNSYYRRDDKQTAAPHLTDRTRIGSGQGFLMDLIDKPLMSMRVIFILNHTKIVVGFGYE